jgi:glycosyltransferase involved in cell wall biosynthesis
VKIVPEFVDAAEFLSGADVFCFPAENEAMGTPLIEALSTGTPVVANSAEPSFAEWIVSGKNGYLVPLNTGQWASAVQAAAEFGASQRKQISQSVNSRISSDVIDEQYFRLLNGLVTTATNEAVDVEKVLAQ